MIFCIDDFKKRSCVQTKMTNYPLIKPPSNVIDYYFESKTENLHVKSQITMFIILYFHNFMVK